jgi:hypothetical protein
MLKAAICLALVASALLSSAACGDTTDGIRTQFVGSYPFTPTERRTVARIAAATWLEVRRLLPTLPAQITLRVDSGTDVIAELGTAATPMPPNGIAVTIDAGRPEGVVTLVEAHLRATLFHELHHLVRLNAVPATTLMDHVVLEGLASAFERDFASARYPWSQYPDDVPVWLDELMALPPSTNHRDWMAAERDGRRWIGYKAGTYLVDRAMKKTGRTSAELATTPTAEIVAAR